MKYKSYLQLVVVLPFLFALSNLRTRVNLSGKNSNQYNSQSDSARVDTAYILKLLKLSSADTLIMHLNENSEKINDFHVDYISIDTINKNKRPYYIHTCISIYPEGKSLFSLGSFRILYKSTDKTSNIYKIKKDSIEIIPGSLDGFYPQVIICDINYDGYKDLIVSFIQNTTGRNILNYFFLYDSTKKQFVGSAQLDSLFQNQPIYIDNDSKEISTGGRVGAIGYWGENYRWTGYNYELYSKETTGYNKDFLYIISKKEKLINGKWEIVTIDSTLNQ